MERSKTFLKNTPPLPPNWGGANVPRTRRGKNPRRIFDQFRNWSKFGSGCFWAKQSFAQKSRAGAFGRISGKWQTHAKYFLGGAQNTHRLFKGGFRKRAGLSERPRGKRQVFAIYRFIYNCENLIFAPWQGERRSPPGFRKPPSLFLYSLLAEPGGSADERRRAPFRIFSGKCPHPP